MLIWNSYEQVIIYLECCPPCEAEGFSTGQEIKRYYANWRVICVFTKFRHWTPFWANWI